MHPCILSVHGKNGKQSNKNLIFTALETAFPTKTVKNNNFPKHSVLSYNI